MAGKRQRDLGNRDRGRKEVREIDLEDTLFKVYAGLAAAGITGQLAVDAVNQMQNQGVLFRERVKDDDDSIRSEDGS